MADVNTQSSRRGCPPRKRARIDSYIEESVPTEDSESGTTQEEEEAKEEEEEDASPSLSSSTHRESLSTSQDHYHRLLVTRSGHNHQPMISFCDRDAILALAAARDPSTIGKLLQQKYDVAWARLRRNSRIINFDDCYQRVEGLLSSLPRDLDPSESTRTHMRQACTTIDQIFDSIHRQVDVESKLETIVILRRLLVYSVNSGDMIPEEFSCDGQGRFGLDGKMFMLISGKFDHKKHEIKRMMVREDAWGGSNWVESEGAGKAVVARG